MISMNIPYFWVNLITTSLFSRTPGIMFSKRNHPQMAELFRLVKNYNVPRYLCVISFLHVIQPSPKKATLENTGKNGATPLYVAALNGSREVVNLLLEEKSGERRNGDAMKKCWIEIWKVKIWAWEIAFSEQNVEFKTGKLNLFQ